MKAILIPESLVEKNFGSSPTKMDYIDAITTWFKTIDGIRYHVIAVGGENIALELSTLLQAETDAGLSTIENIVMFIVNNGKLVDIDK